MTDKFEKRRRKSGFRSIAPRRSEASIDVWRANPNLEPLSPDADYDSSRLPASILPASNFRQGSGISVPDNPGDRRGEQRILSPSTWNENRIPVFVEKGESGSSPNEEPKVWLGGWSMPLDWERGENIRLIGDNRRVVHPNSLPSLSDDFGLTPEDETEFYEREFAFTNDANIVRDVRAGTSFVWSAQAQIELDSRTRGLWVDQGCEITPSDGLSSPLSALEHQALMEAVEITDSTLGAHSARGDEPITDEETGKHIPWSEREYMAPYGFYDEDLLDVPAGIQIVNGPESFGLVSPSIAHSHRKLNEDDDIYDNQIRVRAKRGTGGDYWDWMPTSAKHVWFMRHPYVEFDPYETAPKPLQVFEDWKDFEPRGLDEPLKVAVLGELDTLAALSDPSEEEKKRISYFYKLLATYESHSDSWRSIRRAPRGIQDQAGEESGERNLPFTRIPAWTEPLYDDLEVDVDFDEVFASVNSGGQTIPVAPSEENQKRYLNRSHSSIGHNGGLWLGSHGLDLTKEAPSDLGLFFSPVNSRVYAFGDNFVMDDKDFLPLKGELERDEWMFEVGANASMALDENLLLSAFVLAEEISENVQGLDLQDSEDREVFRHFLNSVDWNSEITHDALNEVAQESEFTVSGGIDLESFTANGYLPQAIGAEFTLLSTSPWGGLDGTGGSVAGEIRPEVGFSVGLAIRPRIIFDEISSSTGGLDFGIRIVGLEVESRFYLADGSDVSVATCNSFVPFSELSDGNLPFRVTCHRKGSTYGTSLQTFGVQEMLSDVGLPDSLEGALGFFVSPNEGRVTSTNEIEKEGFSVADPILVIPSQRSTRIFDRSGSGGNPWVRKGGESRLFTREEFVASVWGISPQALIPFPQEVRDFAQKVSLRPFGLSIGGLVFHDSSITNHESLNDQPRHQFGLEWSSWLCCSERNSVIDLFRWLRDRPEEFGGSSGTTSIMLQTPISFLQSVSVGDLSDFFGGVTQGNEFVLRSPPGSFDAYKTSRNMKLSEGALVAQWKGFANWNEENERDFPVSDNRPYGFGPNKILETSAAIAEDYGSPYHFLEIEPDPKTQPRYTSWGLRFENTFADSEEDRDRSSVISTSYDVEDFLLGDAENRKNFNVCLWVTLNYVPSVDIASGEFSYRIWEDTNIGRVEVVRDQTSLILRFTLYGADVSVSGPAQDVVIDRELDFKYIGTPLHLCFGQVDFSIANINTGQTPEIASGNKICFALIHSPDEPSLFFTSGDNLSGVELTARVQGSQLKAIEAGQVIFGGDIEGEISLPCDFVIGGIEVRKWLFDEVVYPGLNPLDDGLTEPFFDGQPLLPRGFLPVFPLLREYALSRCLSLWGYTGKARVLPDNYAIGSIDGVGSDVFTDTRSQIQGERDNVVGGPVSEIEADYNPTVHPSLFWSNKSLRYSGRRRALYELEDVPDRPELLERLDPKLASEDLDEIIGNEGLFVPVAFDFLTTKNRIAESAQAIRRFWFARGLSPISPSLNFTFRTIEVGPNELLPCHTLFSPALNINSSSQINALDTKLEDENELIAEELVNALDRRWSDIEGFSDIDNSGAYFGDGTYEGEPSDIYPQGLRVGSLEMERIRCEWEPGLLHDLRNLEFKQTAHYRDDGAVIDDDGGNLEVVEDEIVRLAALSSEDSSFHFRSNNRIGRNFPTLSLLMRYGRNSLFEFSESESSFNDNPLRQHDAAVLGNLTLDRQTRVWGFAETPDDILLDEDGNEIPGLPTKFRIGTEDLDLGRSGERRVWRELQGGRQLLRSPRSTDPLSLISGGSNVLLGGASSGSSLSSGTSGSPFNAIVHGSPSGSPSSSSSEEFDTPLQLIDLGLPPEIGVPIAGLIGDFSTEVSSRAFLGKGKGGWSRAIWGISLEQIDDSGDAFVDSLPPNPLDAYLAGRTPERFVERLDKFPDVGSTPSRVRETWRRKSLQRSIRERTSGSPSPIHAGADGLNPFPSQDAAKISAAVLGFPNWTPYSVKLQREFAKTLNLAILPGGGLNEEFLDRASSLWIELTGNQVFPAWLEWARPEGGWGTRGSHQSLVPFLRRVYAPVTESGFGPGVLLPSLNKEIEAPASVRSTIDPARIFEREIFTGATFPAELLLIDRLATFDDEFPVVSASYDASWVRSITGSLGVDPDYARSTLGRDGSIGPNTRSPNLVIRNIEIGDDPAELVTTRRRIYPLKLTNSMNRYSDDHTVGFLRHSLRNKRVAQSFLKIWFGTGDSLSRADYPSWWRTTEGFILPTGKGGSKNFANSDAVVISSVLTEFEAEQNAGGEFQPPNTGGEYSVWSSPVVDPQGLDDGPREAEDSLPEFASPVTSIRPFGPDVRVNNYQNKQIWTRDIKLNDERRINDLWSIRHAYPHEMMQDVTVKPRGWRYGLMDVQPRAGRWAINPKRWGQPADLVRACPDGVKPSGTPTVRVRFAAEPGSLRFIRETSHNPDNRARTFTPYIAPDGVRKSGKPLSESETLDYQKALLGEVVIETSNETLSEAKEICADAVSALEDFELALDDPNIAVADPNEAREALERLFVALERQDWTGGPEVVVAALDTFSARLRDRAAPILEGDPELTTYQPPSGQDVTRVKISINAISEKLTNLIESGLFEEPQNVRPANPSLPLPISRDQAILGISRLP